MVSLECSELERKRDDVYLHATTSNANMRVARPVSDPIRMEKDTSALDKIAGDEVRRQKELVASGHPSSRGRSPGPRSGSPAPTRTGKKPADYRPSSLERCDHSARDKAAHAASASTAGSPAPAPSPSPTPGASRPGGKNGGGKKKK